MGLTLAVFILTAPTVAGIFVIAAISALYPSYTTESLIIAAAVGLVAAVPATWLIVRQIRSLTKKKAA